MSGRASNDAVQIRALQSMDEMLAAEAVQREVWPGSETDLVPSHLLLTAAHNGGLVLGAFDGAQMIGVLFGFLGVDDRDSNQPPQSRIKHCSHLLGVRPAYRDREVGYRLKLAQRDFVVGQGLSLVTWTFDPLESRNAHLNIARLGAVSNTYQRNVYGVMNDGLNAGLASDRLQVDWWVRSAHVEERLARGPSRPHQPTGDDVLIEIPADIQSLKSHDLPAARAWRERVRTELESAFSAGYSIVDFLTDVTDGERRSLYRLSRRPPITQR